jgi:DNA-binding beta-propeller fold protein YncE
MKTEQRITNSLVSIAGVALVMLSSCGGGSAEQTSRGAPTYQIAGKVAGLARGSIVLQNGVDSSNVTPTDTSGNDIEFTVANLPTGAMYAVQVASKPDGTDCRVINGTGAVKAGNVNDILVQCFDVKSMLLLAGAKYTAANQNNTVDDANFSKIGPAAVDSLGNIFVIDGHSIRKITPTKVVTTFAGLPDLSGDQVGEGRLALFKIPAGIAVDASDQVIVADTGNNAVKTISPSGLVRVIAAATKRPDADSTFVLVNLNQPQGITVAPDGRTIYIADTGNHVVRTLAFDNNTHAYTSDILAGVAGVPIDSNLPGGKFKNPTAVAVGASGQVIVVDKGTNSIKRIAIDRVVDTLAGSSSSTQVSDGMGSAAGFSSPEYATYDAVNGVFYVTESICSRIRRVQKDGLVTTLFSASGCDKNTNFAKGLVNPYAVAALPNGSVLVSERGDNTLRLLMPSDIAATKQDTLTLYAGVGLAFGNTDDVGVKARFNVPQGMAAASDGRIYVADTGNDAIRVIDQAGSVKTVNFTLDPSADPLAPQNRPARPTGIAVDAAGNLYISEPATSVIRKIDAAGRMSILAGKFAAPGTADGELATAQFRKPTAIAYSPANALYILDNGAKESSNTIRRIDLNSGNVTTLGIGGNITVSGFAIDPAGTIYTYDKTNRKIYRLLADASPAKYTSQLLSVVLPSTVAFIAFDSEASAYAYDSNGIERISINATSATGNTATAVTVVSSGSKTMPGTLPASLVVPPARLGSIDIFVHGAFVAGGRLYFTDNQSIYLVNP